MCTQYILQDKSCRLRFLRESAADRRCLWLCLMDNNSTSPSPRVCPGGQSYNCGSYPVAGTVSPLVWPCLELLPAINPETQKVQCCWEHGIWRFSAPRACLPLRNVSFIQCLTPLQALPLGQWQEGMLALLESHQYLHFAECISMPFCLTLCYACTEQRTESAVNKKHTILCSMSVSPLIWFFGNIFGIRRYNYSVHVCFLLWNAGFRPSTCNTCQIGNDLHHFYLSDLQGFWA